MSRLSSFTFKPSKKYIFTQKSKSDFNTIDPNRIHSLSKNKKFFDTIKPVRPFNRFIKQKYYGTGLDPSNTFLHFINKDPEKPYKRQISPIIVKDTKDLPARNLRWSLGTTCKCNNKNFMPKIRQEFTKIGAMIDLLPDAAKGPLQSALSQAESLADKADEVIDRGMMMSDIANGGNADAAAGGEE